MLSVSTQNANVVFTNFFITDLSFENKSLKNFLPEKQIDRLN